MSEQNEGKTCKHCSNELNGQFCSFCGRPQELRRINGQYVLTEIGSVLNFQKGLLFTIKELLLRPRHSIRKFIHTDRNSLVKPIGFIILCSLVYFVAQQSLQFEDGYMNFSGIYPEDSYIAFVMRWISDNYGIANIFLANFIAAWVWLFFKKYGYNLFEILVLLYFAMGVQMLLFSLFGIAESVSKLRVLDTVGGIAIIYVSWAVGQFFDGSKKVNYLKAFCSYILGLCTFLFMAIVLGGLIDFVTN